jgi:hypothetical protein
MGPESEPRGKRCLGGCGRCAPGRAKRSATPEELRRGPVPVTELRAGIVVRPGSAAFEIMRVLACHLPVMVTPRWVRSSSPPIVLENLLEYLVRLPGIEEAAGKVYDAAGPETLTRTIERRWPRPFAPPSGSQTAAPTPPCPAACGGRSPFLLSGQTAGVHHRTRVRRRQTRASGGERPLGQSVSCAPSSTTRLGAIPK